MERAGASTEALAVAATQFESIRDELQGKLSRLRGIVEGVRADWQGSAGASFQNVTEAWKQRQADLIAALTSTAQGIRTAGTSFGTANADSQSAVEKAAVDLPALGGSGGTR